MKEDKIKQFIDDLFKKKITKSYTSGGNYETEIVEIQGRGIVETMVRSFILDNRDERLGILEAKVFMYEQIISKSNFAPMIESKDTLKK
jgi:hypothetical protein